MTKINVPRLRFRGFDEEWKKELLKDSAIIDDGIHQTPNYQKKGIPFFSVENLKKMKTDKYISDDEYAANFKNKRTKKGDILMSRIGSVGETNIINDDNPLSFYVTLALIRPNDGLNSLFLNYLLKSSSVQLEIWRRTLHVAFPKKINKNEISKLPLNICGVEEQQKIGSFFIKVDKLIELESQKLEKLKKLKQGYLQKMFPQYGKSLPRVRFSGFSGEWKDDILDNLLHECENDEVIKPEEYKSLKVSLHFKGVQTTNDHPRSTSKGRKYYVRRPGELIIGKQNFHNGGFAIIPDNINGYVASSAIVSFINKSNCDLRWINYYMMNSDWLRRTTVLIGGTGQKEYSVKTLKSLKLKVPSLEEQQKISSLFSKLDQMINNQSDKIDELKQQKKAYLQKMFI